MGGAEGGGLARRGLGQPRPGKKMAALDLSARLLVTLAAQPGGEVRDVAFRLACEGAGWDARRVVDSLEELGYLKVENRPEGTFVVLTQRGRESLGGPPA